MSDVSDNNTEPDGQERADVPRIQIDDDASDAASVASDVLRNRRHRERSGLGAAIGGVT